MKPRLVIPIAILAALSGCGGVRESIRASGPIAATRFDAREIVDVLPPDRISAIDRPSFEQSAQAGSWLQLEEPVVVVTVGQDARAYPLAILVWHEIVNDMIGGVPIAVTYSPLADAAVVFDRRMSRGPESFGVSGKLYRSSLVMVDRRTTSLWTQLDGRAVAGPSKGARLAVIPSQIAPLAAFREAYPAGGVLARPAASGRAYGFNPYARYDSRSKPFGGFIALAPDRRLRPMERVVGVAVGGAPHAFRARTIRGRGVMAAIVGAQPVVLFWDARTRSALDTADISAGRAVGTSGVFDPRPYGEFSAHAATGTIRDRATDSTWNVLGVATAGPLRGKRLTPVPHVETFWFAWSAFHPETAS